MIFPKLFYKSFGKVPYYKILEEIFTKKYEPNHIHEVLEKLDFNYIITTNFDTLIEDRINESYDYDVIKRDEDLAHSSKRKMIIKMHGDLENRNIILKKSDFKEYEKKSPLISTFIKGLFTTNTILFIGYSLNDPNVKKIISWIKKILKDDFRKAYIVSYKNNIRESQREILNNINLESKNNQSNSKGELLKNFLEEINKRKIEKIKEK